MLRLVDGQRHQRKASQVLFFQYFEQHIRLMLTRVLYGIVMFLSVASAIAQVNEWENPKVYERNKLGGHVDFISYEAISAARKDAFDSPYYQTLNGTYYFRWSEDDTRSPNYWVRYATSKTPTGALTIPEDNLVLEKDPSKGLYGMGHNSTVYSSEKEQWYIVCHRFNKSEGIDMGHAAGFHQEVCMDALNFTDHGSIEKVIPTLEGI